MIVVTHLALALLSIGLTAYTYIVPSTSKIRAASMLAVSTLLSGIYLVASTGSGLLKPCLSGLAFLAIVGTGIALAQRKLARQNTY